MMTTKTLDVSSDSWSFVRRFQSPLHLLSSSTSRIGTLAKFVADTPRSMPLNDDDMLEEVIRRNQATNEILMKELMDMKKCSSEKKRAVRKEIKLKQKRLLSDRHLNVRAFGPVKTQLAVRNIATGTLLIPRVETWFIVAYGVNNNVVFHHDAAMGEVDRTTVSEMVLSTWRANVRVPSISYTRFIHLQKEEVEIVFANKQDFDNATRTIENLFRDLEYGPPKQR